MKRWAKRGKEKKRKRFKEVVSILFRLRPLNFFVREKIRRVVVIIG